MTVMELIIPKMPWLFFSRPSRKLRRHPPNFCACWANEYWHDYVPRFVIQ